MAHISLESRAFTLEGRQHRLLFLDEAANIAYCDGIDDQKPWPVALPLSAAFEAPAIEGAPTRAPGKSDLVRRYMNEARCRMVVDVERRDAPILYLA